MVAAMTPPQAGPGTVEVSELTFARGERQIFEDFSCCFPGRRISVVLGGSGSGKTTLLRMLASLDLPDTGEVWLDRELEICGLDVRGRTAYRSRVGMMFQGGALLNSMSVFDNTALPLREHTARSEAEIREAVHAVFDAVDLAGVDALLPGELSGGMLKRAALARALINEPQILLCDEPFSGLDPATVRLVEALLRQVNQRLGATLILTSHHIPSTLRLADHAVILGDRGKALEGSPGELSTSRHPRALDFFAEEHP